MADEMIEKRWRYKGHLCFVTTDGVRRGYVAVPDDHPWHTDDNPNVKIHGGITFAGVHPVHEKAMPHGNKPWWLGFDATPMDNSDRDVGSIEWTVAECEALVDQMEAASIEPSIEEIDPALISALRTLAAEEAALYVHSIEALAKMKEAMGIEIKRPKQNPWGLVVLFGMLAVAFGFFIGVIMIISMT